MRTSVHNICYICMLIRCISTVQAVLKSCCAYSVTSQSFWQSCCWPLELLRSGAVLFISVNARKSLLYAAQNSVRNLTQQQWLPALQRNANAMATACTCGLHRAKAVQSAGLTGIAWVCVICRHTMYAACTLNRAPDHKLFDKARHMYSCNPRASKQIKHRCHAARC